MRHTESLDPEGRADLEANAYTVTSGDFQTDRYTLKGEGKEIWEPRFTYHGFQYLQVSGFPGRPSLESVRGRQVCTSFAPAGEFACSNELLNRIQAATRRSYVSNFLSIPTDCPHREKMGWTGDGHLAAEQGLLNYRSAAAYAKWIDDFDDEQRESGELPCIIPTSGDGYTWGNGPAWDSAYLLIPWYLYLYRGDLRILRDHYPGMKRYVDYLGTRGKIISSHLDWETGRPRKDRRTVMKRRLSLSLQVPTTTWTRAFSRAASPWATLKRPPIMRYWRRLSETPSTATSAIPRPVGMQRVPRPRKVARSTKDWWNLN